MSEPLVIVGNGMAAARLVDELAKVALGRYAIAVIGDEPRLAYNRVLLSSVLAGETTSQDIELRPAVVVARPRRHPEIWLHRHRDRCRPPRTQDRERREHSVFETGADHRLVGAAAQRARRRPRRRAYVPRQPRRRSVADAGGAEEARRGGRRRIARPRSGLWPRQGRRAGDAGASDGPPDGAPARCARGRTFEIARRAQGHRDPAQRQHRAHPRRDARRRRRTGRTAAGSRPTP